MWIVHHHGQVKTVREFHLCCDCCKMLCTNDDEYVMFFFDGMTLYKHKECPPNPLWVEQKQIE
jgi:hypothetical protein